MVNNMFSEERREVRVEVHRTIWEEYGHLVMLGTFGGSLYYSFFYLGAVMQFIPSFLIGVLIGGIFGVAGTCFFLSKLGLQYFMTFSERLGEEILDRVGDDISELRSSGFISKTLGTIVQNYLLERLRRKESPPPVYEKLKPETNFKDSVFQGQKQYGCDAQEKKPCGCGTSVSDPKCN